MISIVLLALLALDLGDCWVGLLWPDGRFLCIDQYEASCARGTKFSPFEDFKGVCVVTQPREVAGAICVCPRANT